MYDVLSHKMTNTIFKAKFGKIGNTLLNKREDFINLSLYFQCYTLMQLINILHANVLSGDLTAIGEAKKSGITTISNKMQSSYNSAKLINQSITGLFEQEIDLLK